jgi:hypothetical protein
MNVYTREATPRWVIHKIHLTFQSRQIRLYALPATQNVRNPMLWEQIALSNVKLNSTKALLVRRISAAFL